MLELNVQGQPYPLCHIIYVDVQSLVQFKKKWIQIIIIIKRVMVTFICFSGDNHLV